MVNIYDLRFIAGALLLKKQGEFSDNESRILEDCSNDPTKVWLLTLGGWILFDKQKLIRLYREQIPF